jgi:hypothetical protein
MKLTEIRDAVTKDLSDYVGDYVFYLYQHGSLRFKIKGYKQYKGICVDKFYDELDKSLGTMALNHLKYGACIDGFGFRIEGTITYEIRHDYIPAEDGDDA